MALRPLAGLVRQLLQWRRQGRVSPVIPEDLVGRLLQSLPSDLLAPSAPLVLPDLVLPSHPLLLESPLDLAVLVDLRGLVFRLDLLVPQVRA